MWWLRNSKRISRLWMSHRSSREGKDSFKDRRLDHLPILRADRITLATTIEPRDVVYGPCVMEYMRVVEVNGPSRFQGLSNPDG